MPPRADSGRCCPRGRSIQTLIGLALLLWSLMGHELSPVGADPTDAASRCEPGAPGTTQRQVGQWAAAEVAPGDPDLEAGFPVSAYETGGTGGGLGTHILVGNIDNDPSLEIMVTGLQTGPLYAWNADGSLVPGWPTRDTVGSAYPTLGKLSLKTNVADVFALTYGWGLHSRLQAYTGDGTLLAGWPRDNSNYGTQYFPATLADVDGDGVDEIFINLATDLMAYRADGSMLPGWPVHTLEWEAPVTPAIADLDGDGHPDVIAGAGGYVYVWDRNGRALSGFPVQTGSFYLPSTPAIGDVDGDGQLEIVIDTGGTVTVISADGQIERTMTVSGGRDDTAPALADMDGDGYPEIIEESEGAVDVWSGHGRELPGWPVIWGSPDQYWLGNPSPVVGDVDGDDRPDIIVTDQRYDYVAEVRVYSSDGIMNPHFPKYPPIGGLGPGPAVADIDLDGRNEIIVAGTDNFTVGTFPYVWVYDLGGGPDAPVEWGQFGGGPQHQGVYPVPPPSGSSVGSVESKPVRQRVHRRRSTGPVASLVFDIAPGPDSSSPGFPTAVGGRLFFEAEEETNGAELWVSDGPSGQTTLVKDIRPGAVGSHPRDLTSVNGTLLFVANDGTNGEELWRSDGTESGTSLVRDIWAGPDGSAPRDLVAVGNTLYFAANDGVHGYELWRSDGTANGTVMVADIVTPAGSEPMALTRVGRDVYFIAYCVNSYQNSGSWLFRSDGTFLGTQGLGIIEGLDAPYYFPYELVPAGRLLYVTQGSVLWQSDGTYSGTYYILGTPGDGVDRLTSKLTAVGDALYFRAVQDGLEPWIDFNGLRELRDIAPGVENSAPSYFTGLGKRALFAASDGQRGFELWRSHGSAPSTVLVKDIRPGSAGSDPMLLTRTGQVVVFTATDGPHGYELWRTDGSAAGTKLLQDISPGSASSNIAWFQAAGQYIFFSANDGMYGQELWAMPARQVGP